MIEFLDGLFAVIRKNAHFFIPVVSLYVLMFVMTKFGGNAIDPHLGYGRYE